MSMLAMAAPSQHAGFKREYPWDNGSSMEYVAHSRPQPDRIELPSIRQAFPEIKLRLQPPEAPARTTSSTTSPIVGLAGVMTPPEYIHSPSSASNKRRRLSVEDEQDRERANRVPRAYENQGQAHHQRQLSPQRTLPGPPNDGWATSARTSPYATHAPMPPMRQAVPMEVYERQEHRPTLPSLPHMALDREPMHMQRQRGHSNEEFQPIRSAAGMAMPNAPGMETAPAYRAGGYPYSYHHPNRAQSLSLGAIAPFDRTPFSSAAPGFNPHYQDLMRLGELGGMGMHGDNKQRKRRGNLPKETTDKLRAWFVAHLQHPYPTEDEKQDLMRQTGLQMNQISNWFINARRRQLPAMINNARAESDATSGRAGTEPGKILPSTERGEGGRASVPLSDGEASHYEEDLETLQQRHVAHIKRGSV
ncbi:Homeobox protein PKNOX1 like [Verticillium longisporum]|nr:Homeobox protein PKNOX1 like [Verticillium longisporum]